MNDQSNHPNAREPEERRDVAEVLGEQTLAVDLVRAEIDQAIATAHRFPRSLDVVLKKIETMACYNEDAALNCIYSLPRGGKPIIGPSIGFANIVAQAWGNCRDGARITYVDRKERVVVAEGAFLDLESNRQTITPVNRRIVDSKGRLYNDDMIMVTGMAAASIARRNAILNAVPRAMWFPIWEQALKIVRGNVETFAELKDRALKALTQFGVKPEQVYMVMGLKGEADLTLEHIPTLRGMYIALRDGSATVEEMFDPRRQTGQAFDKVANPLGGDDDPEVVGPTAARVAAGETERLQPSGARPGKPSTAEAKATAAEVGVSKAETAKGGGKGKKKDQPKKDAPAAAQAQGQAPAAQEDSREPTAASAPTPATEPSKPGPKALPETPESYETYCLAWIAATTGPTAAKEKWKSERDLRGVCRVVEDVFDRCKKALDARVAELEKV